ncbi:MAG: lipid A export permease/ATP-binding protein MsbA [Desulfuromonadia bacterium]
MYRRVLNYSRPYGWWIFLSLIASILVGGMDGAFAWFVEPVLKRIFASRDLTLFALLPVGVVLIFILRGGGRFINEYFIRVAGELAIQDIRSELFGKLLSLSLRFYGRNATGSLMARLLSDVAVMQNGVAQTVTSIFRDGISAISLLVVIFYRSWQMALTTFVVIPLTVWVAQKIGKRIKRASGQSLEQMGMISMVLQESISGIKIVKGFHLEQWETDRFRNAANEYLRFVRKNIRYATLSTPITEFITSLGIALVIWLGGSIVMRGEMSAAEFFSFLTAMGLLYKPIKNLINSYNTIQQSLGAAERVFEIIDLQPDIVDAPDAVSMERCRGEVRFDHVYFSYGDHPVLHDIDLLVKPGEVVAIVGPSGGGKSTLVSLVPRFYDPTEGRVLLDGTDVRLIRRESLIRQVAIVDQEVTLFNDTIANNIRYGNFDATDEMVMDAARAAYADEFVSRLPDGYQTVIGDRGTRLSGGQRQRICIARAILKDAPILILDEATSALDTESEQMVQQALANLMRNRTTFVIAHRLSTIIDADRIVVLEKGRVVEIGTHADLIRQGGVYAGLYNRQFEEGVEG